MQRRYRLTRHLLLRILFLGSLIFSLGLGYAPTFRWPITVGTIAVAQAPSAAQLVQQGVDRYQVGNFREAIALWQTALANYRSSHDAINAAIVLENLARAYQAVGQTSEAIDHWEQVIQSYRQLGDGQHVGRLLTEQAQTYSRLGQYRQAIALLCGSVLGECSEGSAVQIARGYGDRLGEAAALGSLGDAYRLRGQYDDAINTLQTSLTIAQSLNYPAYQISALNSLGNAYINRAQVNYRRAFSVEQIGDTDKAVSFRENAKQADTTALNYLQQSFELARSQQDQASQLRALLSSIPSYYRLELATEAESALQQALSLLEQLPDSQEKVYATIDLADLLRPNAALTELPSKTQCIDTTVEQEAESLLEQAIAIAQRIGDRRSESFALGRLGHLYECQEDYTKALDFTQKAQLAAEQDLRSQDSLYLWEWQMGRILEAQKRNPDDVIAAYEQAIATLEEIRSDLLTADRDLQFDFRDTVDPVYRQLVDLRLSVADLQTTSRSKGDRLKNITSALTTVDSLKLAELQNYFGNDCVLTAVNPERVDLLGAKTETAVINSIILEDRTAVVVTLPDGEKQLSWISIHRDNLRDKVNKFRQGLESRFSLTAYDTQPAQEFYNLLVRPFLPVLERANIKTLVFIHDGILRSIPMAALHDGEKFLIQTYAIATTPTLTLTDPKPLDRQALRALALGLTGGVTIDGQTFPPLSNVSQEVDEVKATLPGSEGFLDQNFTSDRLQQELNQKSYPIIHIATHGKFGTEPEDTFLVTGDSKKLTITDLDRIIRNTTKGNQVELLTLTACQTATGDDRASLGLAGVAIQAGVRSAMASLWFVDDAATAQIAGKFYESLRNSNISKAQALQLAQISVLEAGGQFTHPAYWAPFILIGNWL